MLLIALSLFTVLTSYVGVFVFELSSWIGVLLCTLVPWLLFFYALQYIMVHPPWHIVETDHKKGLPRKIVGSAVTFYRGKDTNPKIDFGLDYSDVEILGHDEISGHKHVLRGWHVPPLPAGMTAQRGSHKGHGTLECKSEGDPSSRVASKNIIIKRNEVCIVCVHGGARDRRALMRHYPIFHGQGYGVLGFDCREHGISTIRGYGIGHATREVDDVVTVCAYVKSALNYKDVVLFGTSQGAVSSLLASTFFVKGVRAVIAENHYKSRLSLFATIAGNQCKLTRDFFPAFPYFLAYVTLWCLRLRFYFAGVKFSRYPDLLNSIHLHEAPTLFMHGTQDSLIPHEHCVSVYEAAKEPKKLWLVPGAEHTGLYDHAPEEWRHRVICFLEEYGL